MSLTNAQLYGRDGSQALGLHPDAQSKPTKDEIFSELLRAVGSLRRIAATIADQPSVAYLDKLIAKAEEVR